MRQFKRSRGAALDRGPSRLRSRQTARRSPTNDPYPRPQPDVQARGGVESLISAQPGWRRRDAGMKTAMSAAPTAGPVARAYAWVVVALRWPILVAWAAAAVYVAVVLPAPAQPPDTLVSLVP